MVSLNKAGYETLTYLGGGTWPGGDWLTSRDFLWKTGHRGFGFFVQRTDLNKLSIRPNRQPHCKCRLVRGNLPRNDFNWGLVIYIELL